MTGTQEATVLTAEQRQRLEACENAARFLRDGGAAVLGSNTSKAGHVVDIIDLAHYITTGIPFGVAHAHEHGTIPAHVAAVDIKPGSLQADALGGLFQQQFGFNPFAVSEDEDTQSETGDERNCD